LSSGHIYVLANKLWCTSLKRWTFAQTVHGIFAKDEAVEDITAPEELIEAAQLS